MRTEGEQGSAANPLALDDDDEVHVLYDDDDIIAVNKPPRLRCSPCWAC